MQSEELVAYSKYSNYLSTSSFLASLTLSRQNVNDKNREPASCYSVRVCQKKNIYITKKTLFFNADVSFIFICSIIGTKNRKRQIVGKKTYIHGSKPIQTSHFRFTLLLTDGTEIFSLNCLANSRMNCSWNSLLFE